MAGHWGITTSATSLGLTTTTSLDDVFRSAWLHNTILFATTSVARCGISREGLLSISRTSGLFDDVFGFVQHLFFILQALPLDIEKVGVVTCSTSQLTDLHLPSQIYIRMSRRPSRSLKLELDKLVKVKVFRLKSSSFAYLILSSAHWKQVGHWSQFLKIKMSTITVGSTWALESCI